jgi:hypothetical protein
MIPQHCGSKQMTLSRDRSGISSSSSKARGVRPGDPAGHHDYPVVVTATETGYYARCFACLGLGLGLGPESPNSEAARSALLLLASPS